MAKFSLTNLFPNFHSSEIDRNELESIIKDAVERDNPDDGIKELSFTRDGIEVSLESGKTIIIDIDWQEIILT